MGIRAAVHREFPGHVLARGFTHPARFARIVEQARDRGRKPAGLRVGKQQPGRTAHNHLGGIDPPRERCASCDHKLHARKPRRDDGKGIDRKIESLDLPATNRPTHRIRGGSNGSGCGETSGVAILE